MSTRFERASTMAAAPLRRTGNWLFRRFRAPREGFQRVLLRPNHQQRLPGWIHAAAGRFDWRCEVCVDTRVPLPFHDASLDAFWSDDTAEATADLTRHGRDVLRCLKPGGVYRRAASVTDRDVLWAPLAAAGFVNLRACLPVRETYHPDLFRDCLPFELVFEVCGGIVVEAERPGARRLTPVELQGSRGIPAPRFLRRSNRRRNA